MTKRILAAVLAVMMVVGVLPTSVFAATPAECVVEETYGDHSKIHCDLAEVSYTEVPNSTVEPECGQDGYTLYECACGAYFADDIIPMDDHKTESGEPKAARVEPTCYKEGTAAIYVCDTCGKDYFDPADPDADEKGVIAKTQHTFNDTTYPGNDCTAAERVCQNEGCTAKDPNFKPEDAHNWVYDDPHAIVKAPTAHDTGLAEFKCGNDGCSQVKTVPVAELDHKSTMTKVDAKAPDCHNEGNIEYWLCSVCNKKFIETANGMVEADDEAIILPVKHQWNQDPTIIPPTCTEWGFSYYGCPLCGASKGVTPETEDDEITKYRPLGHTPYECATHDVKDAECDDCSSYGHSVTEPNCTVDGSYNWVCGRCDQPQSSVITKTGHSLKTIKVPANHKNAYNYTVMYCTNENCTSPAIAEYLYGTEILDVTVEVRNGDVYDLPAGTTFHVTGVTVTGAATTGLVHFYIEDQAVQAPTCTEPGKAFWYCVGDGCNDHHDEVLPATGHNYDDPANDIAATCTTNLIKICDNAGCLEMKEIANTAGHVLVGDKLYTTLPTCLGEFGYDWYECDRCGNDVADPSTKTSFVPNKTYLGRDDLKMTAKEEFLAEHPNCDPDTVFEPYREGDCVNNGYWKASCADCDKTYLVLIDDTGKGHLVPDGTIYHKEATCTNAQGYVEYICARPNCQAVVKPAGKPLGHDMTKHDAVAPTCDETGNLAYWTCSRKCCEDILYKDVDGTATYAADEQIVPATGHNDSVTVVAANCKTHGFTHTICTNEGCTREFVNGFVAMTGHKEGNTVTVDPSCTVDGVEKVLCDNADCTGDDGDADTLDDGIASQKVLPATGHMNAAKQTITDICTDTVADRTCTNANHDITVDGPKVVGKAHDIVYESVAPGCEHFGYNMQTCANGCGTVNEVVDIIPASGHLAPWGNYVMAEDYTALDEDDVAPYGEEFLETDPEQYTGYITAYTPATYESLGSVTFKCCAHCGDEITRDVIRIGMDFTIEVDNAAVAGANDLVIDDEVVAFYPVDGDVIAVDIYMNAYKTYTWGFNFNFDYDAATMNFLGYKYHLGDVFSTYMVNNTTEDYFEYDYNDIDNDGILDEYAYLIEDAMGTVSISAYTEKEMDGTTVDVLVEGTQKVITLYFQLEAEIEAIYDFLPETYFFNYYAAGIYEAWMSNADGEAYCDGGELDGYTSLLLDTNDNGVFNIKDLQNCYDITKGLADFEYLAAADANKDGIIDLTDLDLMNKYLVGKITEKDLYAACDWLEIAPEGFVAG